MKKLPIRLMKVISHMFNQPIDVVEYHVIIYKKWKAGEWKDWEDEMKRFTKIIQIAIRERHLIVFTKNQKKRRSS